MRKLIGYLVIFGLGFLVCMALLRAYGGYMVASPTQARRAALAILDKPVTEIPLPDTAMVRAAAKIEPAVVNIDTLMTGHARAYDFFGFPTDRPYAIQGKGSGVIITADGYIVTNNHVIEGATIIRVTLPSGKQYDGRVIGADPDADIAVVKIDASNLPAADFGDSAALKVGEYVLAIGYPLGVGTTVTHGIVSATDRRDLEVSEGHVLKQAIQTDAPINHGNSGGALADLNGNLVGINTAILSEHGGGSIGIGFAIPVNAVRDIVKRIIAQGRDTPNGQGAPFMGIQYAPVSPDESAQLNLPPGQGVIISGVVPLTGAATAGLQPGDVILAVDGRTIASSSDVPAAVNRHKIGDLVTLNVQRRDGTRGDIKLTLGAKPNSPI